MYAIYGNIYHQYTPNVSIYTIHGSYGICKIVEFGCTGRIERDPEKIAVLDLEKIDPSKPLLFKHSTSCSCHYSPHVQ